MHKVKGYPGFVKDPETGVVQNTNMNEFQRAKQAKKQVLEKIEKAKALEERVAALEELIAKMVDKNGN